MFGGCRFLKVGFPGLREFFALLFDLAMFLPCIPDALGFELVFVPFEGCGGLQLLHRHVPQVRSVQDTPGFASIR